MGVIEREFPRPKIPQVSPLDDSILFKIDFVRVNLSVVLGLDQQVVVFTRQGTDPQAIGGVSELIFTNDRDFAIFEVPANLDRLSRDQVSELN